MNNDNVFVGAAGTALAALGASISVTELQAIISIIVTCAGFVISVLIPLCRKLYKKIKKAIEDGKITEEEMDDILNTGKEIVDESSKLIDEVSDKKSEGEKK